VVAVAKVVGSDYDSRVAVAIADLDLVQQLRIVVVPNVGLALRIVRLPITCHEEDGEGWVKIQAAAIVVEPRVVDGLDVAGSVEVRERGLPTLF